MENGLMHLLARFYFGDQPLHCRLPPTILISTLVVLLYSDQAILITLCVNRTRAWRTNERHHRTMSSLSSKRDNDGARDVTRDAVRIMRITKRCTVAVLLVLVIAVKRTNRALLVHTLLVQSRFFTDQHFSTTFGHHSGNSRVCAAAPRS